MKPMYLYKVNETVRCGRCPGCRYKKVVDWQVRIMEAEKSASSAYFITLTYNSENVPITPTGRLTLSRDDPKLFMKRLRKREGKTGIRYFMCGEYGTQRSRPHYHFLIFDCDLKNIEAAWNNPKTGEPLGNIHCGTVTNHSIQYCLKYMMKSGKVGKAKSDDRVPEFRTASKLLGQEYISEAVKNYHQQNLLDGAVYRLKGGAILPLPKFYRTRLYDPVQLDEINANSCIRFLAKEREAIQEIGQDEYDRRRLEYQDHTLQNMEKHHLKSRSNSQL